MANKYMTLDEAAAFLGISPDKLMRLREEGEIRGFADRGSWKFTRESVEELGRMMEADSSPDIPIISNVPIGSDDPDDSAFDTEDAAAVADDDEFEIQFDDSFFDDDEEEDVVIPAVGDSEEMEQLSIGDDAEEDFEIEVDEDFDTDPSLPLAASAAVDSDEVDLEAEADDLGLLAADDDEDGILDFLSSDSDVRLSVEGSSFDSDPEVDVADSDVQLTGDSDVNLQGVPGDDEDLDAATVLNFGDDVPDSDSDVALVLEDSDSDVALAGLEPGEELELDMGATEVLDDAQLEQLIDEEDDDLISSDSSADLPGLEVAEDIDLASAMFSDTVADLSDDSDESDDNYIYDDGASDSSDSSVMTMLTDEDLQLADGGSSPSADSSELMAGLDSDSDIRLAEAALEDGLDVDPAADSSTSETLLTDSGTVQNVDLTSTDSDSDVQIVEMEELADDDYVYDEETLTGDSDSDIVLVDANESDESSWLLVGTDSVDDLNLMSAVDSSDSSQEFNSDESDEQSGRILTGSDSADDLQGLMGLDEEIDEQSARVLMGADSADDLQGLMGIEAPDSDVVNSSDESAFMLMGTDADQDLQLSSTLEDDDSAGSSQMVTGMEADEDAWGDALAVSDESSRMLVGLDSDSDVRLASDDSDGGSLGSSRMVMGLDSDSDVHPSASDRDRNTSGDSSGLLVGLDSDSDVRLESGGSDINLSDQSDEILLPSLDSDSDVRLALDESDVLRGLDPNDSPETEDVDAAEDSDFTGFSDSDSDVRMIGDALNEDSEVVLSVGDEDDLLPDLVDAGAAGGVGATMMMSMPEDSDLKLIDSSSSIEDDSGISLEMDDGLLSIGADESGISLEVDDSGISLESLDSGAFLGTDDLVLDDDSGITLDSGDSGIALFDDESGISLDLDDAKTQQMNKVSPNLSKGNTDPGTLEMDVPLAGGNDSEFELAGLDDDDDDFGTDTSVLMFDDDDAADGAFSVASQPAVPARSANLDMEDFGSEEVFEDDLGDDFDDFEDEEMDGVWDAEDQDEDDDFESGESQVGGSAITKTAGVAAGAGAWADDRPWGVAWTSAVSVAALMSALSAFVGIELVRTMWMMNQPGQPASGLLSMLGSMFGK